MTFKIVENKKKFFSLSILLIAIGLGVMGFNMSQGKGAFNFHIDFTGGTALTIEMGQEFDNGKVSETVTRITGQSSPQIQKILGTNQVSIKIQSVDSETRTELIEAITEDFSIPVENILNIQDISGTVSREMQKTSIIAVLVSCVFMLIYITIRFSDFRMGISSILALVHDVLIMVSFYAIFRIPVNTAFIAAILTVVGYSINATIVIFDRVRENRKLLEDKEAEEIVDISVWQTMRRSVYTSLTTLFTIGSLYVLGVQSVKEFALPIMVGIISGVYSSIFISGSLWEMLFKRFGEVNYEDYYEHEKVGKVVDPYASKKNRKRY